MNAPEEYHILSSPPYSNSAYWYFKSQPSKYYKRMAERPEDTHMYKGDFNLCHPLADRTKTAKEVAVKLNTFDFVAPWESSEMTFSFLFVTSIHQFINQLTQC